MRLIDAEEVHEIFNWSHQKPPYSKKTIHRYIDMAREVDAVPVIRCKDCALWDDADSEHLVGYCTEGDGEKITFRNEWCCWAERREE